MRFERVCAREGKPVAWEELVKGLRVREGPLRRPDEGEISRTAALEKTRTVDIRSFVKPEEIDDRFFERVLPGASQGRRARLRAAARSYSTRPGCVGIATIVLRDAQHLGSARSRRRRRWCSTLMRYAEELVDIREYHFPPAKDVRKPELQMARTLVENLADKWDPSRVHRRVPREPDEDHQGEAEGQAGPPRRARRAAERGGGGPHGAPAASRCRALAARRRSALARKNVTLARGNGRMLRNC